MNRDDQRDGGERADGFQITDWSRRNLLKLTGAGVGIAAGGGASMAAAGQDETPTPGNDVGRADNDHFLADVVDPVFGYALARGETDDVGIEHVVTATAREGPGAHEEFPQEPDAEVPGSLVDLPVEFFFDPVGIHVEPGDLVHFNVDAGLHTVTSFHEKFTEPGLEMPTRIPGDVPGYTSPPLTPGESWVYQFEEKGVYDYFCFPHLGLGMVGRVVVFDPAEDEIGSDEFAAPATGGLLPNDERVLTAEELDPANVVEVGSVAWADLSISPQSQSTSEGTDAGSDAGNETDADDEPEGPTATPSDPGDV